MKTSRTEAAEARQRIVRAAADRSRRDGIAETGLAGFVPEAGLTAGGFYCYFDFQGRIVGRGTRTRVGSGRRYDAGRFGPLRLQIQLRNLRRRLSLGRASGRSWGFAFAALGSEVARADGLTRSVATNGFLKLSIWLQARKGENSEARRHDAIVCGSAMIGALTMSRLVDDSELSDKIREKTRNHLSLQRDARGEGR
jgi:TetR/AcrR family transcriptional repressor of nem operon